MTEHRHFVFSTVVVVLLVLAGVSVKLVAPGRASEQDGAAQAAEESATGNDSASAENGNAEPEPGEPSAPLPWESAAGGGAEDEMIPVENPRYNREKPLLFDSGYEKDNASCMVCHIDFETETLSATHLKAGITCMGCHGDSLSHRSDEFNIIRPDVIWGRAEIAPFCMQCHTEHENPEAVEAFRRENLSQRRETGRYVTADSPCTDCHGEHAIMTGEGNFK